MLVRFTTDGSVYNLIGFNATYQRTNSAIDCDTIIDGTNNGFITSPNYPANYGIDRLDCRSLITAPAGYVIVLRFIAFGTEQNYDFVEVNSSRFPPTFEL